MSWGELHRLVEEAEADRALGRALRHCRSRDELVLAARRLGYRITRADLHRARQLHHQVRPAASEPEAPPATAAACQAGAASAAPHGPSIPFPQQRRGA